MLGKVDYKREKRAMQKTRITRDKNIKDFFKIITTIKNLQGDVKVYYIQQEGITLSTWQTVLTASFAYSMKIQA